MIRSRIPPPPAPDPCPEPLRRILIKAMAPDPELRYQSAARPCRRSAAFRGGGAVQAATEDLDATRRTVRRDDERGDDAHRRDRPQPRRRAATRPRHRARSADRGARRQAARPPGDAPPSSRGAADRRGSCMRCSP